MVRSNPANSGLQAWPAATTYSEDIPAKARNALREARLALGTPSLSIVGSARAIDHMLKARDYKEGSLYVRINKAAEDHVITEDMKAWAHEVRLEANDERHADEDAPDATEEEAARILRFAEALAELLFELPARVKRGRQLAPGAKA
ncbi:DUF4145 domain-containing protein [Cupriavidus necator]|uniref:DUF4145 domain-containing protein n=1 Tax=Cupriavidus necator TaxID=106590 RepID=UPI00068B56C4|nr:DUF4145 domain-containing protein [Cupriavidus necator]